MKRILSILFAALILVSGMHLSYSIHFCGGKFAASKLSFSEQTASCGMETGTSECPNHSKNQVNSDCCKNTVSVYSIEKNYNLSSFDFKHYAFNLLQVFLVPSTNGNLTASSTLSLNTSVSPPINLLIKQVSLPDICVFRI